VTSASASPGGAGAVPSQTPGSENGKPRAGTATDPAAPGSTGGPTGAPATTTTAPPASATAGPPSDPRTFDTEGGTVRAECTGAGQAHLLEVTAVKPYKAERIAAGPAASASVDFRHGNRTVRVVVTCAAGTPSADIAATG
jgi:serine/threonine-protein kinase